MFAFFSSMASRGGVGLARPWEASRGSFFLAFLAISPFDLSPLAKQPRLGRSRGRRFFAPFRV